MGRPYHILPIVQGVLSTMVGLYETHGWHHEDNLSPAETNLATALYDAGVQGFKQQHTMGRYTVDFWFPAADLVVEVDGKSFHRDTTKRDHRSNELLTLGARRVIHIDASTTFDDPDGCVRAIRYYLNLERRSPA